jgi:endonuclease YncB( thermonuclease family)
MPNQLGGHVQRVKDGDTVTVALDGGGAVDVRLWGIDAPEKGQPYGRHATVAVREVAGGEYVRLEPIEKDRYGRVVGRLKTSDDLYVGDVLVGAGVAWHDRKHAPNADRLRALEQDARRDEAGLWAQDNPVPPWRYRKRPAARSRNGALQGFGWFLFGAVGMLTLIVLLASL